MDSPTVLGTGSAAVVLVPKAIENIEKNIKIEVSAIPKPSIMTYDLTGGAYSYVFTISDLVAAVAAVSTLIFLSIALNKWFKIDKFKRRKSD